MFLQDPYNGDFSSVCTGLWCVDVNSLTSECVLIIPGQGTTCGDKKVNRRVKTQRKCTLSYRHR